MTKPLNQPGTIHARIARIMAEVGSIEKTRQSSQGYSFRGIDDVYNLFHPLMIKHGVFCVPNVTKSQREERPTAKGGLLIWTLLTVQYTLYAEDGTSIVATVEGEGMDSSDKSTLKAMSGAQKALFIQTFTIPTKEGIPNVEDDHFEPRKKLPDDPIHRAPVDHVQPQPRPQPLQPKPATDYGEALVPFGAERVKIKTLSRDALVKKIAWAKDKPHYNGFVEIAEKFLRGDGLEIAFGERVPVSQQRKAG